MPFSEDNSTSENETSRVRLRSKNELVRKKSLRYKNVDEILRKDVNTLKSVIIEVYFYHYKTPC